MDRCIGECRHLPICQNHSVGRSSLSCVKLRRTSAGGLKTTSDNAEDFKQGAMFEKAADTHAADGTLLKIPLC
jgi:hypothetical protein